MAKLEVLPKRVDVLEVNSPESVFGNLVTKIELLDDNR